MSSLKDPLLAQNSGGLPEKDTSKSSQSKQNHVDKVIQNNNNIQASTAQYPPPPSSSFPESHSVNMANYPTPDAVIPSTCGQVSALVKLYLINKKRHWIVTGLELLMPILSVWGTWNFSTGTTEPIWNFPRWTILLKIAPLVMTTMFFVHFLRALIWLNWLKTEGFRQLMHTMGLKKHSLYLGVSLVMLVLSLPFSILFGYTIYAAARDSGEEFSLATFPLSFILYPIQIIAVVFLLSSIINSYKLVLIFSSQILIDTMWDSGFIQACKMLNGNYNYLLMFVDHLSPHGALRQLSSGILVRANVSDISSELQCPDYHYPSPSVVVLLMAFWSLAMFYFAWHFDEVCPWQSFKSPKSMMYCLKNKTKRLWFDERGSSENIQDPFDSYNRKYFEKAPHNRPLGIYIDNVTKKFTRAPVVDSLSLSIYSGQTTLLLGHNGAGKTTLMNMITGNLAPSQGKLYINGYDIDTCFEDASSSLGLCPQESILLDDITVEEHVYLLSGIKCGYSSYHRDQHIDSVLKNVGLVDHRYKLVSELSGGMKRKLSLALAFVGNSKVLILDEPSSGLDPESRKFIWDSIRLFRANRTVLLSTQHMEEADYLGDRIAIMDAGKIVCCGSSIFLKKAFGSGYKLRIECNKEKQSTIISKICEQFPKAKLDSDTQAVSNSNQNDIIIELISEPKENLEDKLIKLFEEIEHNQVKLGIKSFGLRCSTIEDVLLNSAEIFKHPTNTDANTLVEMETSSNKISLIATQDNISSGLFSAFMRKHMTSFYRRLFTTILWHFLIPIAAFDSVTTGLQSLSQFSPSLICRSGASQRDFLGFAITAFLFCEIMDVPLNERTSKFKLMQMCTKANRLLYWTSRLAADMIFVWLLYYVLLISWTFYRLDHSLMQQLGGGLELAGSLLFLWIPFGLAMTLLAYLLTLCFDTLSGSSLFIFLASYMFRIIPFLMFMAERTLGIFKDTNMDMIRKFLYYIIPTDTITLASSEFLKFKFCTGEMQSDAKLSGLFYGATILSIQALACGILIYLIEARLLDIGSIFSCRWCRIDRKPSGMDLLDEDVTTEEIRARGIMSNPMGRSRCALIATELTKSYGSKVRAVDGITFAMAKNECFGLLGANGAGKSTTFSMISGEVSPDNGKVLCNNHDLYGRLDIYQENIGYDPQQNPRIDMTPMEALYFMGRLRGIREDRIKDVAEASFYLVKMQEHSHKMIKDLSGGTKRKLSLALTLLSSPPVLMLDEPTAGIDPMARRDIWMLLNTLKSRHNSSIVISSHAMEECEAICDRLTIMVNGRLRCLGSFQHLRSKFGQGYVVKVQFEAATSGQGASEDQQQKRDISYIFEELARNLGHVSIDDTSLNSATFKVKEGKIPRSLIFRTLKAIRAKMPHVSYLVSDSTLEDIFVSLAREQLRPTN